MEFNRSEWGEDYMSPEDQLNLAIDRFQEISSGFDQILAKMRDATHEFESAKGKSVSPGAKFILMHYLGMMPSNMQNKTNYGKLFKILLGNGNEEDFRKWLSEYETQIRDLKKSSPGSEYFEKQPLTLGNISVVCDLLEAHKLDSIIKEPFTFRSVLESLK